MPWGDRYFRALKRPSTIAPSPRDEESQTIMSEQLVLPEEAGAGTKEPWLAPRRQGALRGQVLAAQLRGLLISMRPHQWVKNTLVFSGLIFAQLLTHLDKVVASVWAFAAFCLASS